MLKSNFFYFTEYLLVKKYFPIITAFSLLTLINCSGLKKEKIDLIVYNGTIYTVNQPFEKAEAMAINAGKIVDIGTESQIIDHYRSRKKVDLQQQYVYPGFIDAHCHFIGLGLGLQNADLTGTKSWEECLAKIAVHAKSSPQDWIIGRGWDQNDWDQKEFPTNEKLNALFPDRPVLLKRIDGHAAIVNSFAISIAKIDPSVPIKGGSYITKDGNLTGVLIDKAIEAVELHIPEPDSTALSAAALAAQAICFENGLTSVSDAGLKYDAIRAVQKMYDEDLLDIRMYIMVSDDQKSIHYFLPQGPIMEDRLSIRSLKLYVDGALGSRGAALLEPYSDAPETSGLLLMDREELKKKAMIAYNLDFQVNTHCIGDAANRMVLDVYGDILQGKNSLRWRIEHAQIVNEQDVTKFGNYSIIPSVQPTHATSDMYWAGERIGKERIKTAYNLKTLLKENGVLPLGTDFPVEEVSPLNTFFAAVFRQDKKLFPEEGFQIEEALSREEALRGMTIWAAYANFEEDKKGSLEAGKFADFVVLNKDIMKISREEFNEIQIEKTYVNGKKVFEKETLKH
jgi:predicted amidohydrolase YtcJ